MSFRVIDRGTDQTLVYDMLLVLCRNLCRVTHRLTKIDVKQSNDREVFPRSPTEYLPYERRWAQSTSVTDGQTDLR